MYNGEWRELRYDAACERLHYGEDEKYFRKPYNFHLYQFLVGASGGQTRQRFARKKEPNFPQRDQEKVVFEVPQQAVNGVKVPLWHIKGLACFITPLPPQSEPRERCFL